MDSLLNKARPPVFCPGCTHERILSALDNAFQKMNLKGNQIVMVSDIGCSGLSDTFFQTHAFHGLHGRALTYAAGIKLTRPESNVVVTMGDGGLGIGGAHLLSACRRNLNLTLLIMNNFNFGMTGGQSSATTFSHARTESGFLNQLELPLDVCQVAASAGSPYVCRCSAYDKTLAEKIEKAIRFDGFALMDIWGICPGRYTKKNKLTPKIIDEALSSLPCFDGPVERNSRKEYGKHYRELAATSMSSEPLSLIRLHSSGKVTLHSSESSVGSSLRLEPTLYSRRQEVIILGSAGQGVITAGEILCRAGMFAGLNVTQKSEYDITVLRGVSITEVILSPDEIDFTGTEKPAVIIALSQEGVNRRKSLFQNLDHHTLILRMPGVNIPKTNAKIHLMEPDGKLKKRDAALAGLSEMVAQNRVIQTEMLQAALNAKHT